MRMENCSYWKSNFLYANFPEETSPSPPLQGDGFPVQNKHPDCQTAQQSTPEISRQKWTATVVSWAFLRQVRAIEQLIISDNELGLSKVIHVQTVIFI